jgi:hypothetical protein
MAPSSSVQPGAMASRHSGAPGEPLAFDPMALPQPDWLRHDLVVTGTRADVLSFKTVAIPWQGIITLISTTSDPGNCQWHIEARPNESIATIRDFKAKLLRFVTRMVNVTTPFRGRVIAARRSHTLIDRRREHCVGSRPVRSS